MKKILLILFTLSIISCENSYEKKNNLIEEGFFPSILNEEKLDLLNDLLDTDYLFINFPPSKSKNYLLFLEKIYSHKKVKDIKKVKDKKEIELKKEK